MARRLAPRIIRDPDFDYRVSSDYGAPLPFDAELLLEDAGLDRPVRPLRFTPLGPVEDEPVPDFGDEPVMDETGRIISGYDPGMGFVNPDDPWSDGFADDRPGRWQIEGEQPTADELLRQWSYGSADVPGETPEEYWQREVVPDAMPASIRRPRRTPSPPTGDADMGVGGPYADPYAATLPPVLEPGALNRDYSGAVPGMGRTPAGGESLGDPATPLKIGGAIVAGGLGAAAAGAGGITGLGGRAVLPWLATEVGMEELEREGIPARKFSSDVGRQAGGFVNNLLNPDAAAQVMNPRDVPATSLDESYDKYSIPLVSGVANAMGRPENLVPGIGFVDAADIARGVDNLVSPAAKAANEALPDSLKLVGGSRAAQRGQVVNPLTLLRKGQQPAVPAVGPTGAPAPGTDLDRVMGMWAETRKEPSLPQRVKAFGDTIGDKYLSVQEAWTDRFARFNALSPESERAVALAQGIPDAQMQRATDISAAVRGALGDAWDQADDHLDTWLHMKQAIDLAAVYGDKRKIPGGIKGAAGAQQVLNDLAAVIGPDRYARLEAAGKMAVAESAATLNKLVDNGLVSRELADTLLTKYPHYNKQNILRLVDDELSAGRQVGKSPLSVTSANLKRLTEEGTESARTSPYASIIGSAADAEALIFRNRAARQVAEDAIAQGIGQRVAGTKKVAQVAGQPVYRRPAGEIPGTVSYMENGERVVVEVPAWFEKLAKDIGRTQNDALSTIGRWANSLPRSAFVTYNPAWPAANLVTDYLTVAMTKGVTPLEELRGLWGALKDLSGNDPVLAQMRRSGAGQAGWFAKDAREVQKLVQKSGNLAISTEAEWKRLLKHPWELLGKPFQGVQALGQVAEQGTRRAVYQTAIKRGASTADAALEARRATIDFARGGTMSKGINNFSLFFNAALQGSLIPGRVLRDSPRARYGLGAAVAANLGVYAWNRQFPEYEDVPRDVKRGSAILMLPSDEVDANGRNVPRYVSFIPKTREWGLFFGTQNYILEALDGKAQEDFGKFLSLQLAQAAPADASLAAFTQPGQVIGEQIANVDTYRNKPIVPPELEGLPATEQYDAFTSETIKELAQKFNMSPLRLQHAITGMVGGAGRTVTSITDPVVAGMGPQPDPRIVALNEQLQAITAPNVPADEVQLRRREFLNGLSVDDREAVSDLLRQPKNQVPVLGAMAGRFVGERGGEVARIGRERAAAETGVSITQTQQVGKALADVSVIIDRDQEAMDRALEADPGKVKEWREAHSRQGQRYADALTTLGVVFPGAAQVGDPERWREYQKAVYTLAGQVDDRRTKGQLLAAGYRAIPLDAIDPLTKDFDTFNQKRAEYKAALSDEDQALLKRTLEASMTPTEKRYAAAQETLRPYWELSDRLAQQYPAYAKVQQQHDQADPEERLRIEEKSLVWAAYQKAIGQEREALRRKNPSVSKALVEWYGYKEPKRDLPGNLNQQLLDIDRRFQQQDLQIAQQLERAGITR